MDRTLGRLEHAFTLTNEAYPLVVVGVLRLIDAPSPDIVRRALVLLQDRHPLLRVSIDRQHGQYRFKEAAAVPAIPLRIMARQHDTQWQEIAEAELNRASEATAAPLVRGIYLYEPGRQGRSELIFAYHHAIMDGAAGVHFYHELLSMCAAMPATGALPPLPAAEDLFPPRYRGLGSLRHIVTFVLRQLGDEIIYRKQLGRGQATPINVTARCQILTLRLSPETTSALVKRTRHERITLNSALLAALLLATWRHRYAGQTIPLRALTFANLRPYLKPPVAAENLGCYISMLRYTSRLGPQRDFWSLAQELHDKIHRSTKRGDKFLAALLSKQLLQTIIRLKAFRLGAVALSYLGVAELERAYGQTLVIDLHGFISNNVLGPEYTAFAKILFGQLSWDILTLDTDMDRATAQTIAAEVREILEAAIA